MDKLLPCPCGKVPDHLSLSDNGQGGKWAQATCPDCGEWSIEFRTGYKPLSECQGEALEAWNAAPRAQPEAAQAGWQPIETAPKDGRHILLLEGQDVASGMWREDWWEWHCSKSAQTLAKEVLWWRANPTHWMPLPDPPAALDRARKGEA